MEKEDLEYILMALEYALHGPVKDDDHETHFNLYSNAIEIVKRNTMYPKFEVVAEYPKCKYKKGDVLVRVKYATKDIYDTNENIDIGGISLSEILKFPHLFKETNQIDHVSESEPVCKKCGSNNLYQYSKTVDECQDCGNLQNV